MAHKSQLGKEGSRQGKGEGQSKVSKYNDLMVLVWPKDGWSWKSKKGELQREEAVVKQGDTGTAQLPLQLLMMSRQGHHHGEADSGKVEQKRGGEIIGASTKFQDHLSCCS